MSDPRSMATLRYPVATPPDAALDAPPEWADLRARCPLAPVRFPSGDPARLVTRYEDVRFVLSDPRFVRDLSAEDAARVAATDEGGVFSGQMASMVAAAEAHQRWRRLVARWFTARRMLALRPAIAATADRLIDEMAGQGAPADLVAALAFPLPVWVICDMLGVPDTDRDRFAHWSNAMLNTTAFTQDEVTAAHADFGAYMAAHVADRRARPGDDLLSELTRAVDETGTGFSDAELVFTGQGLLIAGHETTAGMIAKMVAMLLADRSRWALLLAEPALCRRAVEEVLRFDANPGFGMPRYAIEDVEVAGERVPRGTTLVCSMASANRDASAFADADEFDLARSPNPHLTFGTGRHACLGQSLARTELEVTLEALLRRLPGLRLAVPVTELRRVEGLVVGRLEALPVTW